MAKMSGNDLKSKVIRCDRTRPIAVDLFCGSGAVTAALKANGYHVAAAVDFNDICRQTYVLNHPEVRFRRKDIRQLQPSEIAAAIPRGRQVDLMAVCAPCQPFSSQNRRRGAQDTRAPLILESVRLARALKPRMIIFENVPGIAASPIFQRLQRALATAGYVLGNPLRVDAADYCVPQRRVRCIVAALRAPARMRDFTRSARGAKRVTVRDVLGNLRPLSSGECDPSDALHVSRTHHEITLKRLAVIPQNGGGRDSLPPELQLACHKNRDAGDFCDVYGRMRWDDVAPTLTTGCTDVTRGRYAHPRDNRAITLREAARLQTFPDQYRFAGNRSQIAEQIGNAVPFEMIRRLICGLRQTFASP
ncbi:MAG: DNA cytosine methyltransferase [Bacteroidota bacterium]